MAVLIDKSTRLLVQGLTGREGTFHAQAGGGLRHDSRRRRDAGQGRHDPRRLADLRHRPRRGREDRRQRVGDFRAAAVRGRRGHGSRRRRAGARRLHHRGHSDARHDAGDDVPQGASADAPRRPELPRHHLAGQGQGGHHPRAHLQGRPDRHRVEERHAHLRSDPPADAARPGPDHLHRHRRRSADRHDAHRRAEAVRRPIRTPTR